MFLAVGWGSFRFFEALEQDLFSQSAAAPTRQLEITAITIALYLLNIPTLNVARIRCTVAPSLLRGLHQRRGEDAVGGRPGRPTRVGLTT